MGKYFGTDGFRGEANQHLTAAHAFTVGRFLGAYYGKEHHAKILIGKDTRRSGDMLEAALTAGLTAAGADAYCLGVTTTPSVSHLVKADGFDGGIMISASHNPFFDNGIKLIGANGEKPEAAVEEKIEAAIDGEGNELPLAKRGQIGRRMDAADGKVRYIDYLLSTVSCSFAGKRIGLDCANGSASAMAGPVFERLMAKTYLIHHRPDGENINSGCGSTHPESLMALVKEEKLDAGFAYDGDADRCLAVDENGILVDGDKILYICGKYLKEKGRLQDHTVVTTVMSNLGLYKALDKAGIAYAQTPVGDKYVYACMAKNGYSLGGEQSGHIIFRDFAATGDGILTSLMLMQVLLETGMPLSALASDVKAYPQFLMNVPVLDKESALKAPALLEAKMREEAALSGEGRILLRASGTEPLIRIMVEAKDAALCEEIAGRLAQQIA